MKTAHPPVALLSEAVLAQLPDWLRLTARHVEGMEFGQVVLTIHQGRVIEVQRTERTRLHPAHSPAP